LLDHRRNGDVLEEFKMDPAENKLIQYKQKWLNPVSRMEGGRHPKQVDYRRNGRRRPGRPLKRLLDGYGRDEA
jgi:hypothetical protein